MTDNETRTPDEERSEPETTNDGPDFPTPGGLRGL